MKFYMRPIYWVSPDSAESTVNILFFYESLFIYIVRESFTEIYSEKQSDGNGFYGDVVQDSFNKGSRDGDNILDQK